jgi:nucleotide-binding universal stress UspA family protein
MTFVLGYDESEASQEALDAAIDLAARYAETLVVVYGVAPPGSGSGEEYRQHEAALEEIGLRVCSTALHRADEAGVHATAELVPRRPAEALIAVADEHDARMIVVGTHGASAFKAALMGATTYRLLHMTSRPVLVVPTPDDDTPRG